MWHATPCSESHKVGPGGYSSLTHVSCMCVSGQSLKDEFNFSLSSPLDWAWMVSLQMVQNWEE